MNEWKEYRLGDVAEIVGGGTPKTKISEYWNGEIAWLTPRDLSNFNSRFISNGERNISEIGLNKSSAKLLPKGTVLLSSRAPIGYLAIALNEIATNQGFRSLIANSKTDNIFLFYLLKNNVEYLKSQSTGTTFGELAGSTLKSLSFSFPPLPEQKAIAEVLSSLDDKIDLLHRQNKTLEAMAETLFRQWFIEEAQPDWEEITLNDIVERANTGLDAIRRAPIVEEDTGIKCLRIQDISQRKSFEKWGNSKVKETDYEKAQLIKGDIIMARTCSPGIIFFARENLKAVFNNGLARIRPDLNKTYPIFLYYLFKTDNFVGHIYGISDGTSVQLNMKLGNLLSYELRFPPKSLQDKYHPYFVDIDNKIHSIQMQIRTLEKIRDTLLPKLMSGEVSIKI